MVTRMKLAHALMSVVLLAALTPRGLLAGMSTNEIDRVFALRKDGDVCSVFTNAPHLLSQIARMQKNENAKSLSRYYMERLVSFDVTTNMNNAGTCLREKGKMLENACNTFSWFLGVEDVRILLEHVSTLHYCETNHMASLIESAKDKDEKLGFPRQHPGRRRAYSGTPSPNVGKALAERSRLREWNDSVDKYRAKVVELSRQLLDEIWWNVPGDERAKNVDMYLSPYVGK